MNQKYREPLNLELKKGSLSRMLGVPEKDNIPLTLLRKIVQTETGTTIRNPTKKGKRKIKVTRLLKKRARFALTMKTKWRK